MSLSLDPLRPYADLLKALAALLLAALLVGLGWYAGAGKWKGKYEAADAARATEVAAHKATRQAHADKLDSLAKATAAVAAKAKAASTTLANNRKTNNAQYAQAVADAARARAALRDALRRGDVQLQPWWSFDPTGALTGDPAAVAGGQDGYAEFRIEGLLQGVQDGDEADAWITWLQSELTSTRQAVIAAGCAVEAPP